MTIDKITEFLLKAKRRLILEMDLKRNRHGLSPTIYILPKEIHCISIPI